MYAIVMGILRAVVPAGVAYVAGRGWISAGSAGEIGAALIAFVAAMWSATTNTQSAQIATVAAMPEIAKVTPLASAPLNVQTAANTK